MANDATPQQAGVTDGLGKTSHKEVYQRQANMKEKLLSTQHFRENTELKQSPTGEVPPSFSQSFIT